LGEEGKENGGAGMGEREKGRKKGGAVWDYSETGAVSESFGAFGFSSSGTEAESRIVQR